MAEYTVLAKEVEYIPEWNGNRDDKEPIVATLGYLTAGERSQCISGREVQGDMAVAIDFAKALRFGLRKLANFRVNGKKIETAKQLIDLSGFDGLFQELASRVWNMSAMEDPRPLP